MAYDVDGPRVRLGVLWVLANAIGFLLGRFALGALYSLVAAAAASQAASAWRARRHPADPLVAGLGAGLVPLAAAFGGQAAGVAVLAIAAVAIIRAAEYVDPVRVLAAASFTLQAALFAAGAAAAPVLSFLVDPGAMLTLFLLVAMYEAGDFLIGSGAATTWEGPSAGLAGLMIMAFGVGVVQLPPFDTDGQWWFFAAAVVLAPAGQLAASLVLPDRAARAPALRRLDSLLLLGPVWVALLVVFV